MIFDTKLLNIIKGDPFIQNMFNASKRPRISINPTNACNLACTYCYKGCQKDNYSINESNIEELKKIIQEYVDDITETYPDVKNNFNISVFGGEISIYKNLKWLIEKLKTEINWGREINLKTVTNGYVINDDLIELAKTDFNGLTVSLDPKKVHDITRINIQGKETYESVLNNIIKMSEMGVKIGRNCTISEEVIKMYEFKELLKELNDVGIRSNLFFTYDFVHNRKDLNIEEKKFIKEMNNELIKSVRDGLNNCSELMFEDKFLSFKLLMNFKILYRLEGFEHKYCNAGENFLTVYPTIEGIKVSYCENVDFSKKEKDWIFFKDKNKNPKILDIKEKNSTCRSCKYSVTCMQSCPLFNRENDCNYTKKFIAKDLYYKFRKLIQEKNFYNKYVEWVKNIDHSQGEDSYKSYIKNKEFWLNCLKRSFDVDYIGGE